MFKLEPVNLLTHEKIGGSHVITILDDTGKDCDVELHFEKLSGPITLRQCWDDNNADVIILSPVQTVYLRELLVQLRHEGLDS